jgi:hypothetical protein
MLKTGITSFVSTTIRARREHIMTLLLGALWVYVVTRGGPWRGFFTPDWARDSLMLIAIVVGVWLAWRLVHRWPWPHTALDYVLPVWFIAFAISTLANLEQHNRIGMGLWFTGLYILVWYLGNDILANKLVTREQLVDALLLAGVPILIASVGDWIARLPRLVSYLENPNILGAFLVLIVPLAAGRCFTARGLWRIVMIGYFLLAVVISYAVESRGAWLGLCAAVGIVLIYWRPSLKWIVIALGVPIGLFLIALHGDTGRFAIYDKALHMFLDKPLTGYGLFTYRFVEIVPGESPRLHTHAHDVPLHIAAELGIPGLLALAATLWAIVRAAQRNWSPARLWAVAALVGTAAHQIVDIPIMTPVNALSVILVLCVAITPDNPQLFGKRWLGWAMVGALVVLTVVLFVVGMVNRNIILKIV